LILAEIVCYPKISSQGCKINKDYNFYSLIIGSVDEMRQFG